MVMVHMQTNPTKPKCPKCGSGDVDADEVGGKLIHYCLDCGLEV